MCDLEMIRRLREELLRWCDRNNRAHSQKSALEREADDLAAILDMKLTRLDLQMQGQAGHEVTETPEDRLSSLFTNLALLAKAGAVGQAFGDRGLEDVATAMQTVQDAADAQLAEGLSAIDRGNYLRAKGETGARLAMIREKEELVNKKLKG